MQDEVEAAVGQSLSHVARRADVIMLDEQDAHGSSLVWTRTIGGRPVKRLAQIPMARGPKYEIGAKARRTTTLVISRWPTRHLVSFGAPTAHLEPGNVAPSACAGRRFEQLQPVVRNAGWTLSFVSKQMPYAQCGTG
jgi:hypothetical protein